MKEICWKGGPLKHSYEEVFHNLSIANHKIYKDDGATVYAWWEGIKRWKLKPRCVENSTAVSSTQEKP